MKYKIKNHIIDAKSPVEALKIYKLLTSKVKDYYDKWFFADLKAGDKIYLEYRDNGKNNFTTPGRTYFKKMEGDFIIVDDNGQIKRINANNIRVRERDSKCKDSQEELDYLTEEEERAVDDYRKAIGNTTNPKLLKLYQHILGEELEHIDELTSAELTEDACKTRDNDIKSKALKYSDMIKQSISSENWQVVANDAYNLIDMLKRNKLAK